MNPEGLGPGMKGGDGAGHGAKILGVGEEFAERMPSGVEEEMGDDSPVVCPEGIEFPGNGEDGVVVVAMEKRSDAETNPAGDLHEGAEWTGSVFAGVIPDALDVPVRAFLDVAAECLGAAPTDGAPCLDQAQGQLVFASVSLKVFLKYLLDR